MKWLFYVIVFIYMCYRAVYGIKDLNVYIEPINYDDDLNFLPSGAKKTIACKITNKNQKVEWVDPSGTVVKHENTNRVFSQMHLLPLHGGRVPALLLTFHHAVVDDSGVYVCRSDKVSKTVQLCVIDPSDFVDTITDIYIDEGRSYTLTCQARGEPEPRLTWTRNGEIIEDSNNSSKYKVMTKYNRQGFESLLTVISLEPDDSGIYTCTAIQDNLLVKDCSLSKSLNISLQVNYAPVFADNKTEYIFAKTNESVELSCSANAFPKPTFRWFHDVGDNTLFEYPPKQINISEDGNEANLTIVANSLTFGQKFTCRATNDLGDSYKIFTVMKLNKPEKPDEIEIVYAMSDMIGFNLTWYDETPYPIDDLEVQYLQATKSIKRKIPKESEWRRGHIESLVEDEQHEDIYMLLNLDADTEYWMRFRAKNEIGTSAWSDPILASTTVVTPAPEEATEADTDEEGVTATIEGEEESVSYGEGVFYGLFFVGGVLILSVVCAFAMRLV